MRLGLDPVRATSALVSRAAILASAAIAAWTLATLATAPAAEARPPGKPAPAKARKAPADEDCLSCHGDVVDRASGQKIAAVTAPGASVHVEAGIACVDCHVDAGKAELPHPEALEKVACATCHEGPSAEWQASAHGESVRTTTANHAAAAASKAATCVSCHGTHDIRRSKDETSRTNHFNVPKTCLGCHADPRVALKENGPVPEHFKDSIHGRALDKSGLTVAPNCASCHGAHGVRGKTDPESRIHRKKIPETCGSCHAKIVEVYQKGVHGLAVKRNDPRAPVCSDCHSSHEIQVAGTDAWRLEVLRECSTCHEQAFKTYGDTYHGQVTTLGFARIATCADCHGAHDIKGRDHPESPLHGEGRVKACQKCHEGASKSFAAYDPHADPHDRKRNPLLWATSLFMKALLTFVFGFFGVHTLLWLPRSWKERKEPGAGAGGER